MKELIEAAITQFAKKVAIFVLAIFIITAIGFFTAGYYFGSR